MSSFLDLKTKAIEFAAKTLFVVSKNSPTIYMVVGIIGAGTATVMACRESLKIEGVMKEADREIEMLKSQKELVAVEKYSEQDFTRDLTVLYARKIVAIGRLYLPSAVLGLVSIGCIVKGHNILNMRNAGLVAAYGALESGFKIYRQRVIDEYGPEKDDLYMHGETAEEIIETTVGEDGKKVKSKSIVIKSDGTTGANMYARWFDENVKGYQSDDKYNLWYLTARQNQMNDRLKSRGYLFLNEVYEALNLPVEDFGQLVGWLWNKEGAGDEVVDFGLRKPRNTDKYDWTNGNNRAYYLDFNVDGVIFDKL